MPVQDGDTVLGINLVTGLTEAVIIPSNDSNVRPIPVASFVGLLTLRNIQSTLGGTLNGLATELYDVDEDFLNEGSVGINNIDLAPYIVTMDNGMSVGNFEYRPTDEFDPSLEYQILNSSGDTQVDIALEPDTNQGGGGGGSGGGGGGSGQGQGDGDGEGGDIEPFPPLPDSDLLPHTCSDEEPPEPQPGEPGEPPEPGPPEEPCAACAAGQAKGEGPSQSGTASGSGQNSQGEGSGEGSGEGQGEPSGEGQGEPSEGDTPSDSGQPTPDNQSGEASGGSESAPPQDSLLQQLLDEQEARDGTEESTPFEPSESAPPNADDFMDESEDQIDEPSDNYDDIFDDTPSPTGEPSMSPDDFMDTPPQDPSPSDDELPLTNDNMDDGNSYPLDEPSSQPRPFENLSDEELQQLIDELRETPEPTNPEDFMEEDIDDVTPLPDEPPQDPTTGPGEGRGEEPSNRPGDGQPSDDNVFPESNDSTSSNESGQSWLWINVGTGELNSGVSAPPTGIWRHALYLDNLSESTRSSFILGNFVMTFDEVRRLFSENFGQDDTTFYQPLPTMLSMEFSGAETWVAAQRYLDRMEGQYWDIEKDDMGYNCTLSFNYLEQSPDTEPRWVSMGPESDGDITTPSIDESRSAAQEMVDRINQENQMANDRDIPTGYGEGSTSPFIPDAESNAALQQEAVDAGANAGKADAQMAQEGASNETDDARQQAQQNARDIGQSNDLDSALEIVESAVENAQRANASADPNNPEDVNNRNQAVAAANEVLDSASELLDPNMDTMDGEIKEQLDAIREDLNELEVGESSSLAQSFAEEAKNARDNTMEADNSTDKAAEAIKATENAVESRNAANEGDSKDREAVQEAINMAQQSVDAATEAGEDMVQQQELIDSIPPFNELPDLAIDAEARMRDTMPGEFADVDNPDLAEDMMAVAEQAVSNLEQAVSEANPSNQYDRDATEFIMEKTNATIDNVEGSWSGDPEEIEELRERVNEALKEFSEKVENICALWNPNTMSWYRGTTGDILIFKDSNDTLIYGVQRGLIPATVPSVPENWEIIEVKPIGVGGVI